MTGQSTTGRRDATPSTTAGRLEHRLSLLAVEHHAVADTLCQG
ncbi:hypothetical protein [Rugosimonospora africana]|nr:hypothetical protein [Rugosimonospora africana]